MAKCKLCNKDTTLFKHHVIPKYVLNQVNPSSELKNICVYICEDCHNKIHFSYLNHMIMYFKNNGGEDNFKALKFLILEQFLKEKYNNIFKEWGEYYVNWIGEEFRKIDKENKDEKKW